MSDIENLREAVIKSISDNYENIDFYAYINHCVDKWNITKKRNDAMNKITEFLCEKYNLTRDELINSTSTAHYNVRGVFFYSLKTFLDLSYGEISIMIGRPKGSVYKIVTDIEFMVTNAGHKNVKEILLSITNELTRNKIITVGSPVVKNDRIIP